jgi:hypothetical protein
MEYRHCKYTITGAYVCDKKKNVEGFAAPSKTTPPVKVPTPTPTPASFNCPNYNRMNNMQKKDAACVVLKRYDNKEVSNYFSCSNNDRVDGMITCKNKDIINSCVPSDKRITECSRCCPQVNPNAPQTDREFMLEKRESCMLSCKKDYDPTSLVVTSSEVKVDPSLKADKDCIGEMKKQKECYTEQCENQFRIACIKAGRVESSIKVAKLSVDGRSCSGSCIKKSGCTTANCDMTCDLKCTR